mgnify:CR=1 FL=1
MLQVDRLYEAVAQRGPVCVGLDTDPSYLPEGFAQPGPFMFPEGISTDMPEKQVMAEIIREKEVYLILNSQYDLGLIELVRRARELNFRVGRDISIISYNESPINEIILNGLTTISTDFRQMGVLVARMILEKSLSKVKCDFQMICRNTF